MMMSIISLRHDMLGDAYYTGALGQPIEEGMSSRDQVQDWLNPETTVFTSNLKEDSLAHSSIKTTESRQNQQVRTESSLLNNGNHWFL